MVEGVTLEGRTGVCGITCTLYELMIDFSNLFSLTGNLRTHSENQKLAS